MARYAPPPAEVALGSDSDEEFTFDIAPEATNGFSNTNNSTNQIRAGGLHNISNPHAVSTGIFAVGGDFKSKIALKSKIPVASPNNNGVNIEDFRLAIIRSNVESAKNYIEQGVDVNITFKTGWTPLMYAAHQVSEPLITLLLDNGATPNLGTTTALMTCCTSSVVNREEDIENCINLLVTHGADVDAVDKYGMTPLMMACKKGHIGAIQVLLDSGADVNKLESRGFSPLCWACNSGNLSCIRKLVENGADISIQTVEGQSPMKLAQSYSSYPQISAYFNSLPGFKRDKFDDETDWIPPPTNNTHNVSNGAEPPPSLASTQPSKSVAQKEAEHADTVYSKFGDLEVLLFGLDLSSLIPLFQSHNVTLDHLLNITDDELIKVGVHSVGHRKKILDSVHELHKKDWQPSSIPAYEKVKTGKELSCAEVTTIVANVANHSNCITASLKYMTSQIQKNPSLLQVDKHGRGLHALRRFLHELNSNTENQVAAGAALRQEIEKTLESGEAETVDHIARNTSNKSSNRLVIYSSALITLGIISLGAYILSKKIPNVRLPFTRP